MFWEVVLRGTAPFGDMLTVLHYETATATPDWQGVADAIRSGIGTNMALHLVPSVAYEGITVREDTPGSVGVEYNFTAGNIVGTAAEDDLGPQMAMLVRKIATSGSNPARGRVYQGGLSMSALGPSGTWSGTIIGNVQAFWSGMITVADGASDTANMVIKASNLSAPNTVPYNPVTSVSARSNPVTQRRRRIGTGS